MTAQDRAEAHADHGHQQWRHGQGTEGHTWTFFRHEARQLNRYFRALALAELKRCSEEVHCAIKLSSFLRGAPWTLMDSIARCESGYRSDARNPSSSAGGVYQWLESSFASYSRLAGHGGTSRFEVWPNVDTAGYAIATGGPGPWAASQGCWG